MRTTLAIDDDILAAARHLALRERKPLGEIVSELARRGLGKTQEAPVERNGILLLPSRQPRSVTLEIVNQLRDEEP
jgi:hypothetical protein